MTAIEQTEARPRGTRLPRRARRNQLLGAAQEVFVAQGYHAAAMDDIAERAGVSKPVLYQHFPGKLELYLALLDQHCEALLQAVRTALASTTDNKKRVEATMDAYFAYVEDEGGAFRLVFESDLTNEPAVRERVDKVALQCAEAICEVIAEDTGLAREQSMLLAVGLGGVSQVVARYWLSSAASPSRDQAVELLTVAGLARHRGLPAARCRGSAALSPAAAGKRYCWPRRTPELRREKPWRSRSACSTRRARSSSRATQSTEEIEKAVAAALTGAEAAEPRGRPRPQGAGACRPAGVRRDRRTGQAQGRFRRGLTPRRTTDGRR